MENHTNQLMTCDDVNEYINDKIKQENFKAVSVNSIQWGITWILTAIILVSIICVKQSKIEDLNKKLVEVGYIINK